MIVCPNCTHHNPDGATQCEACYTPLPLTTSCPNCGAAVQADATFCGQCGYDLRPSGTEENPGAAVTPVAVVPTVISPAPNQAIPVSVVEPEPIASVTPPINLEKSVESSPPVSPIASSPPVAPPPVIPTPPASVVTTHKTQLQQQSAKLLHVQTNTTLELSPNLTVIHIGKPNDLVPPDIDVSGFPNSEVVSRVHSDIRVEGDAYYIEDVGSSNGTYINNLPLSKGNRHRLRPGDRISLGKGDLVSFLFQLS